MSKAAAKGPRNIEGLIGQLVDPAESTRKEVLTALSQLEDPEQVKTLMGFCQHRDSVVRYVVKKALTAIGQKHPDLVGDFLKKTDVRPESAAANKVWLLAGLCLSIILLHNLVTMLFLKRNQAEVRGEKAKFGKVKSLIAGDLAGGPEKYNRIDFRGRQPVLKIRGFVASVDRMRRTAILVFNSAGDRCLVNFPEGSDMQIASGERIEVEGELLRNDNIGPVQLEAQSVKRTEK